MNAQHRSSPEGRVAFANLCERYWFPLYAHARRREPDVHRARDLIQGFFVKLIEKNYLAEADPLRGRFRTFLIASFHHFVSNEQDKRNALKRGGGRCQLSFDFVYGDQRFEREPVNRVTPTKEYQRLWARTLLQHVLSELRSEYEASGRAILFDVLQQYLTHDSTPEKHAKAAARLEMSVAAVKVAVHRLRGRYRELLQAEIAKTVSHPDEVDDEIRDLFDIFVD